MLRVLLLLAIACLPLAAQPLLPFQPVGFQDVIFANVTATGSASLTTTIYYPATASGPGAPLAPPPPGGHPTIVFLHGKCADALNYTYLPVAIASQGFIVVLEDSAGCLADLQRDDGIALFHTLAAADQDPTSFLYQAVNMQKVGVAGHSMGAANVGRILANNPGFKAGVALGIWIGSGGVNWHLTSGPLIQDPVLLIHGVGDGVAFWQPQALAWWNTMTATNGAHVLHLFDSDTDHFNIALPAWPGHGTALDFEVFLRAMEVLTSYFRRFLVEDPTALEYVVGDAALNGTHVQQIMVKVGQPQLWSSSLPATGQTHCLKVLSAPGFAGIYVATASVQIPTPIGELFISPTLAVPLVQGPPNMDSILPVCLPMPADPGLIGSWFIHQALGTSDAGALLLSNPVNFTIIN